MGCSKYYEEEEVEEKVEGEIKVILNHRNSFKAFFDQFEMVEDSMRVVNSHKLECFGNNNEGKDVLKESETAIVPVYEDGLTYSVCRYFPIKGHGLCRAEKDPNKRGECKYLSGPRTL